MVLCRDRVELESRDPSGPSHPIFWYHTDVFKFFCIPHASLVFPQNFNERRILSEDLVNRCPVLNGSQKKAWLRVLDLLHVVGVDVCLRNLFPSRHSAERTGTNGVLCVTLIRFGTHLRKSPQESPCLEFEYDIKKDHGTP